MHHAKSDLATGGMICWILNMWMECIWHSQSFKKIDSHSSCSCTCPSHQPRCTSQCNTSGKFSIVEWLCLVSKTAVCIAPVWKACKNWDASRSRSFSVGTYGSSCICLETSWLFSGNSEFDFSPWSHLRRVFESARVFKHLRFIVQTVSP